MGTTKGILEMTDADFDDMSRDALTGMKFLLRDLLASTTHVCVEQFGIEHPELGHKIKAFEQVTRASLSRVMEALKRRFRGRKRTGNLILGDGEVFPSERIPLAAANAAVRAKHTVVFRPAGEAWALKEKA